DQADAYRHGKEGLLGYFVGQVMRATGGRADARLVNDRVRSALELWGLRRHPLDSASLGAASSASSVASIQTANVFKFGPEAGISLDHMLPRVTSTASGAALTIEPEKK